MLTREAGEEGLGEEQGGERSGDETANLSPFKDRNHLAQGNEKIPESGETGLKGRLVEIV